MRSIMTDNLEVCYFCGTTENIELHHCIHGSKTLRQLSTTHHLLIGICSSCHRGPNGVHREDSEKDAHLKREAQKAWEERRIKKGKSKPETVCEDWIRIFGVDYISEGNDDSETVFTIIQKVGETL